MKFLPAENITYKTKLSGEEVIRRISDNTIKEHNHTFSFFGSKPAKYFEGTVSHKAFKVKRVINYRNSFLPVITGELNNESEATTIKVKMRLHFFVMGFLCVWLGGVFFALLVILSQVSNVHDVAAGIFIPCAMLMFGYLLTMGGFKAESSTAKKYLRKIFEAEIVKA